LTRRGGRRGPLCLALAAALALLLGAAATRAEVSATHNTLITFDTEVFPRALPRHAEAPIGIRIDGHLKARKAVEPSALTAMELGIQRAGHLTHRGLPVCDVALIDPASTSQALQACPGARVGYGRIRAQASFPGTEHFYFNGRVVLFNGRLENGRPALLLHVFNPTPPASFVFPLTISHRPGRYGTVLSAHVRIGQWSHITDFQLVLRRTYLYRGERRSYLSASCPAPVGFTVGISPFVQATLSFADGTRTKLPVLSSCKVAP
jgi:hypothetical protein